MRTLLLVPLLVIIACDGDPKPQDTADTASAPDTAPDTAQTPDTSSGPDIRTITPATALSPEYIFLRASGNIVPTGGQNFQAAEISPDGAVVATSTFFADEQWPRQGAEVDGDLVITGFRALWRFNDGLAGTATPWVPQQGNRPWEFVATGGTPRALWGLTAARVGDPYDLVRFDDATPESGAGWTVVKSGIKKLSYASMTVAADNTVYLLDNLCRLLRVMPDGTIDVVAGPALDAGNSCPTASSRPQVGTATIPQGRSVTMDPTGTRVLMAKPNTPYILDITPAADGRTSISVWAELDPAVKLGFITADDSSVYALDSATGKVLVVTAP